MARAQKLLCLLKGIRSQKTAPRKLVDDQILAVVFFSYIPTFGPYLLSSCYSALMSIYLVSVDYAFAVLLLLSAVSAVRVVYVVKQILRLT